MNSHPQRCYYVLHRIITQEKNTVCADSGSDLRLQNVVDVGNSDDRPLQQLSDGWDSATAAC